MEKLIRLSVLGLMLAPSAFAQVETTVFEQPYRLKADGEIIDVKEVGHSAALIYDYNKDGKMDLLVGYFGVERAPYDRIRDGHAMTMGGCNIYLNRGTNESPKYTYTGKVLAGGELAFVATDCCVGFTPKIVDLDGDGIDDLISGSFPGQAYFWKGIGIGMFEKHVFLKDESGVAMNPDHTTTVTPFDWDDDGDLDLVWGVRFRGTYLSINKGTKTNPVFAKPEFQEMPDYHVEFLRHERKLVSTNTVPVDWDKDGLFDLVCGTDKGDVIFYKNTGKKGTPVFTTKPEVLIECKHDHSNTVEGDDRPHGFRTKVFPYDYNGDGKLDLLVGDIIIAKTKGRELTPEEQIEKEEMEAIANENWEKNFHVMNEFHEFEEKRYKEIMEANPDLTEVEARGMAWHDMPEDLKERLDAYRTKEAQLWDPLKKFDEANDKQFNHGFVWVYIRK